MNKTILGVEYPKIKDSDKAKTQKFDFIKKNKEMLKNMVKSDDTENQSNINTFQKRPFTPNAALIKKVSRFFASRNRPDLLFESGSKPFKTYFDEEANGMRLDIHTARELPSGKFVKTIYNKDALKLSSTNRPASAIQLKYNSCARSSERSRDSLLESMERNKFHSRPKLLNANQIPENCKDKMCKRKRKSRY